MNKNIAPYLFYYSDHRCLVDGIHWNAKIAMWLNNPWRVKPILRRLKNMTEKERSEFLVINNSRHNKEQCEANNTIWLMKHGFWLFGDDWFDEGLILDADTILKSKGGNL